MVEHSETSAPGAGVETETRSILFMDLAGWSNLTPIQICTYLQHALPRVADIIQTKFKASHLNTWGDALVATFSSAREAAECALDIRDHFRRATEADGIPAGLTPRLSLHLGEVIVAHNPLLGHTDIFGEAVHLAARLEPVTPHGIVYCTEIFASVLMTIKGLGPVAHRIGSLDLPKNFGTVVAFAVTGPGEPPPAPPEKGNPTQDAPPTEVSSRLTDHVQLAADQRSFEALQAIIDSDWMVSWEDRQARNPQYVFEDVTERFSAYQYESKKPERQFFSETLRLAHEAFLASLQRFMSGIARIMVPEPGGSALVIRTKAEGHGRWIKDYDERYRQEVTEVVKLTNNVCTAWQTFMKLAAVTFLA